MPGDLHFLLIEGIKGESIEPSHKDWIEVDSLDFGISNPGPAAGGVGFPSFSDVTLVRRLDKASVKIAFHCAAGTIHPVIEFHATTAISNKAEIVYSLKLTSAAIKSYRITMPENSPAVEIFQLGFRQIEAEYTARDNRTGRAKGKISAGYDVPRNQVSGV